MKKYLFKLTKSIFLDQGDIIILMLMNRYNALIMFRKHRQP
jgi:hypothetical protein